MVLAAPDGKRGIIGEYLDTIVNVYGSGGASGIKAISVKKVTSLLVFSPACCVAQRVT
jgi:hypothetical protein